VHKIIINNQEILPGQSREVRLSLGRLPISAQIYIKAFVFRSINPGPTMLLVGGMHGDEVNGVESIRRCLEREVFKELTAGSVIVIPVVNVYGFLNYTRDVEGRDVNRNFPGKTKGSLASRIARTITRYILPQVDFAIDLHSGGDSRYNHPQVRYTGSDMRAAELAHAFNAPVTLIKSPLSHSMRKIALHMQIPVLIYEGGESKRFNNFVIEHAIEGVLRVLAFKNMIPDREFTQRKGGIYRRNNWIRAGQSGMFVLSKYSGEAVEEGEQIGKISDPYNQLSEPVFANKKGFIIGHNNAPIVLQGEALFHIAYQDDSDEEE